VVTEILDRGFKIFDVVLELPQTAVAGEASQASKLARRVVMIEVFGWTILADGALAILGHHHRRYVIGR
jgi:hypothetical protein